MRTLSGWSVAVATLLWCGAEAGAQEAEVIVDTCKVSAKRHTDDFTGKHVLVTRVTDPKGNVVGGATVEFDPKNGAQLVVTTPSGIQVTVSDECEITPEVAAIKDLAGTVSPGVGNVITWTSTVEGPELAIWNVFRRVEGESDFAYHGKTPLLGVGSNYTYVDPFLFDGRAAFVEYRLDGYLKDGTTIQLGTVHVSPPSVAIRDFVGTVKPGSGINLSWTSTLESRQLSVYHLSRRTQGESDFLLIARQDPLGVGHGYGVFDQIVFDRLITSIEYRLEGYLIDGTIVQLGTITMTASN